MNPQEDLESFLKLAKPILIKWQGGEEVAAEEINSLMPIVFRHQNDEDEAMKKMFILAMQIEEHRRWPPQGDLKNVEGLANLLNELTFLAKQS